MGLSATASFVPAGNLSRFCEDILRGPAAKIMQASCTLIESTAKEYCPVDTGALRESIATNVEDTDNGVIGTVYAGEFYAPFVEFGTGQAGDPAVPHNESWPGMPAQPYMRPALDENRAGVLDLFAIGIGGALRAA